jgi:signal transduction histidine kinase
MTRNSSTRSGALVTFLKNLTDLRHSVIFRLTIWYAGLFTASLFGAFLAFYLVILHNNHGISHHALSELREDLVQYFGLPVAIVILLSSAGGWLMARRALSGVNAIKKTASEISRGALDRRVTVTGRHDEIDQLAETFNEMLSRVQAVIEQMREITENIAHDLRSPITRMRGTAELVLIQNDSNEEHVAMAGTIVEECDHLLSMINTMLDISEAEAGLLPLRAEETDLLAILVDLCDFYQPLADDRQVKFIINGTETLIVSGDRGKLQRIFANLLDNALKYTHAGGTITLTATGDAEAVEVKVGDTGEGINENDLPHIFDRFFRSEKSRSEPGNGLGLSLAQAFVLLHQGTIAVTSRVGQGSTFAVTLPRRTFRDSITKR